MTAIIELKQVDKTFGQNHVLNQLDITIQPGELIGLIGPSGAGKSTLIAAILGMLKLDGGQVTLLNAQIPNRQVLGKVGYMAQNDALYTTLTGYENLAFFGGVMGLTGAELKAKIQAVTKIVDLTDALKQRVSAYSGGMKRRLSLAIALLPDAPLYILDEPTVGIDPELRVQIWAELEKLHTAGKTIIVTTHVMAEVENVDRVLMIRDGNLIANAAPQALEAEYDVDSIEQVFIKAGERYARNRNL
ncbi:MAG: ABC transporter ATP-binding protein [Lactobacillaceae bacterium]|jgi:ABC-2 type transport system ATP-binding protein|nr:ABC transporter ATP-binding protein [Lactobacillaceae bacterium]